MAREVVVRRAVIRDASQVDALLSEWFDWKPKSGRLESVRRAIRNRDLLIAKFQSRIVGFVHYVMHENVVDGGLNSFISALYVSSRKRGEGVGSLLLEKAILDSLSRGAVGVETSTIHAQARMLYERHHFKQTKGDIAEVFLELDVAEYLKARRTGH